MSGYPFVASHHDAGKRSGPVLGFVIHMAEGGGTVHYLANENPNGVSVHYVIERSGRIVQMLREDHMHTSINPTAIRTTDGPAPYGATAARAVLGSWHRNPNNATLAVELEGFALSGPGADQHGALRRLVADIRTRWPAIGLLGHRDFAAYKRCPGGHIDWPSLGGHGPASEDDDVIGLRTRPAATLTAGVARLTAGTEVIRLEDRVRTSLTVDAIRSAVGPFACEDLADAPGYLVNIGSATCWVRESAAGYTAADNGYNAGVDAAVEAAATARRP